MSVTDSARPDSPVRAMLRALAGAWRDGTRLERACYLLAAALFASGAVHGVVHIADGGSWSGPLSLRKPTTFGLSFGLTLATITWVLSFVPIRGRGRGRAAILTVFALACLVEVVMISAQAWRGQPSHFGVTGPGAGLVAAGAAGGGAAIVVTMTAATVAAWRPPRPDDADQPSESMRLALRAGFASLLVALALGVYMLARGMIISRAGAGVPAAFAFSGGVKPGHAATMHGVLVLPALAWLLSFTDRPERSRLAVVRVATLGYLLFAGVVVIEVLVDVDPLDTSTAPLATTTLIVAGGAVLLGAWAMALVALLRTRVTPRGTAAPSG